MTPAAFGCSVGKFDAVATGVPFWFPSVLVMRGGCGGTSSSSTVVSPSTSTDTSGPCSPAGGCSGSLGSTSISPSASSPSASASPSSSAPSPSSRPTVSRSLAFICDLAAAPRTTGGGTMYNRGRRTFHLHRIVRRVQCLCSNYTNLPRIAPSPLSAHEYPRSAM